MNINPVATTVAAALHNLTSSAGSDGDGDHGVEPAASPVAQPSLPSGSTYSVYA